MGVEFDRMRRYYALTEWTPEKQELAGQVIHDLRREGVEDRARISALEARCERYREALKSLVEAKALSGVRDQVAGWNGENKADGPYSPHPRRLGAVLPKTNCGAIYDLDDALEKARAALSEEDESDGNNL